MARVGAMALLTLFGVTMIVASGGGGGATTFSKSFGGEQDDWLASAVPTRDGGYLFVGNRDDDLLISGEGSPASRIWVVKLDSRGDVQWEHALGDPALAANSRGTLRTYHRLVAAADGGAWIVGNERDAGRDGLLVVKLDANGQVLWARSYDSTAQLSRPLYLAGDTVSEGLPVAAETLDGNLWVAAATTAYVKQNDTGVQQRTVYLLKVSADGTQVVGRHTPATSLDGAFVPTRIRALNDGGVALVDPRIRSFEDHLMVADAGGVLRSRTFIVDGATIGDGSRNNLEVRDFTGVGRGAEIEGFAVVGNRGDQSFVARYFNRPRDPDDPGEGAADFEYLPLENDWRIEIGEMADIWAAGPACDSRQYVNGRCSLLVVGKSRATPGEALIAVVDPDANVSSMNPIEGIDWVCSMRREANLTPDGRVGYRLHVRDTQGRSGTLLIDEQRVRLQSFIPIEGDTCDGNERDSTAFDGEIATFAGSREGPGHEPFSFEAQRYRVDGTQRWNVAYSGTANVWTRAVAVRRTDDGFVIAAEYGVSQGIDEGSMVLIKLDGEGGLVWQRRVPQLEAASRLSVIGSNVLAVQDGRSLLIGADAQSVTHALEFARDGSLTWQSALWDQYAAYPGAVTALRDGGWLVGGGAESAPLVRFDRRGERQWTRALLGTHSIDAVDETPAGEIYVAARRQEVPSIAKLDAGGQVLWSQRISMPREHELPIRMIAMGDGGALLALDSFARNPTKTTDLDGDGETSVEELKTIAGQDGDLVLLRFDPQGNRLWERRYGGAFRDRVTSLTATDDGGALLGALSYSLGTRSDRTEAWLLRLGTQGEVVGGCGAELVPNDYEPTFNAIATLSTVAVEESSLFAAGPPSARESLPNGFVLQNYATATSEARHCTGAVASPRAPGEEQVRLRVLQGNPNYSGVIASVPNGILCGTGGGGTCEALFDRNLLVTLEVDPGSRAHFEGWSGCASVSDDAMHCQVSMAADRTITATFAESPRPPIVPLAINGITGRGVVTGTGGIQCRATVSGTCATTVSRGSTASLTATPDRGRSFLGWDGACASFGNTRLITFVMNDGFICGARFSGPPPGAPSVSVQLNTDRAGNVTSDPPGIDCGAANSLCTEGFARGSNVTLTARATQPGYEFESYLCPGTGRVYTRSVTLENLSQDAVCQANFSDSIERLYLRVVRDLGTLQVQGRVYAEDGGLDCREDCDRPFPRDQVVILRAEPWPVYVLSGWSGCIRVVPDNTNVGAPTHCEVRMDQRHDVVAFFSESQGPANAIRNLVVNFVPGSAPGQVTSLRPGIDCRTDGGDCIGSYDTGNEAVLDLVPLAGSTLASHDGCDTFTPAAGSDPARCHVTMVLDRTVTIGFTRPNSPPLAAFTFEPNAPLVGQSVTFDAGGSSDDKGIARYAWSFTDNGVTNATSSVAAHTYAVAGTYTVRLTVTDGDGATDDEVHTVVVSDAPSALPVITQQPLSVTVSPGETATFTVSANPVGGALSYRWQRNGADIPGATRPSYTTAATTSADDGAVFRVVVSNLAGSVVSASAVLTVGHGWRIVGGSVATGGANNPSLAFDAAGTRYVAYTQFSGGAARVFVKRLDGANWVTLGVGAIDPQSTESARGSELAIGADGLPVVAWAESSRVRVARWDGTQWTMIGDNLAIDTTGTELVDKPQLARSGSGWVVAWTAAVGFPPQSRLAMKRYDPTTQAWSGDYVPNVLGAEQIHLALDGAGRASIAYSTRLAGVAGPIRVVSETATGWAPLGGAVGPTPVPNGSGLTAIYGLDIKFDAADAPTVLGSVDGQHVFAFRFAAAAWQPLSGTDGVFISLAAPGESTALMAFTRSGSSIDMAYTRLQQISGGGSRYLTEFLHWNGTTWNALGDPLVFLNYSLSAERDAAGNPLFAAEYRPPGGFSEVVVQQFVP